MILTATEADFDALDMVNDRLAAARDEAAESHRRLITAMQAMDDGIAFLDNDERLIQCNEAYGRFMQHMPEIVTPGVKLRDAMLHAAKAGAAPRHEVPQAWQRRDEVEPQAPNLWQWECGNLIASGVHAGRIPAGSVEGLWAVL